jgi:surfeit locus 1 family protein
LKKISFNIFVFFSILIFCSLGTWQIYRLQWKLNLINEIENGLKAEPVIYSRTNIKNYQRIKVSGKLRIEKQIFLYSLNENGVPGFDIITPLTTRANEIILINRGWIKKNLRNNEKINDFNIVNFNGILKKITKSNPFKPKNDLINNIWYTLDINDLQSHMGYKLDKYILFIQDDYNKLIIPKKVDADLPNNHLKYALTWYSIALSILLYFLYFRQKE